MYTSNARRHRCLYWTRCQPVSVNLQDKIVHICDEQAPGCDESVSCQNGGGAGELVIRDVILAHV
jgi:hypothetical protein